MPRRHGNDRQDAPGCLWAPRALSVSLKGPADLSPPPPALGIGAAAVRAPGQAWGAVGSERSHVAPMDPKWLWVPEGHSSGGPGVPGSIPVGCVSLGRCSDAAVSCRGSPASRGPVRSTQRPQKTDPLGVPWNWGLPEDPAATAATVTPPRPPLDSARPWTGLCAGQRRCVQVASLPPGTCLPCEQRGH